MVKKHVGGGYGEVFLYEEKTTKNKNKVGFKVVKSLIFHVLYVYLQRHFLPFRKASATFFTSFSE